jgi:hypothetical protein
VRLRRCVAALLFTVGTKGEARDWEEVEEIKCPLRQGQEYDIHMLLQCPETANWRSRLLCNGWLNMNEEVVFREIVNCSTKICLRDMASFLYQFKLK